MFPVSEAEHEFPDRVVWQREPHTVATSTCLWSAGLDAYLGVLVAQRALFNAQESLVAVRAAEQQNLVSLYKVLGGGV